MPRLSSFRSLVVIAALVILTAVVPGCGKKANDQPAVFYDFDLSGKGGGAKASKVKYEVPQFASAIKGKITFKGPLPNPGPPKGLLENTDCKAVGNATAKERSEQAWLIDPTTKAVENVLVFVAIPRDKYFELPKAEVEREELITIDQPHCAFMPHVQAIFPEYYDGKKYQPTRRQFEVKNSATFGHNFNFAGDVNGSANLPMPPGSKKSLDFKYEKNGDIIKFSCNIHNFMYGRLFTFDHPFFAVTKEDGLFDIKGAPTGALVTLKAWHEALGYFEDRKVTLKAGDNVFDFVISAK